jgi:RNA polymerase sigma-70 factor (ECF subfamily)
MKYDLDPQLYQAVRLVQSGQREAFREIVDAMLPAVRVFVAGRSLPGLDVDEVVQRTFVEAFQGIGQFEAGTNLQAWLLSIARYQLMMETTRLQRLADYHAKYVPIALARATEMQFQVEMDDCARVDHLRDCMNELPEHARQVLRERYESGRSFAQMAILLGRSEGAIRKQLCLLRQQLHDCVMRKLSLEGSHE